MGSAARSASTIIYSIARAWQTVRSGQVGFDTNITCLVTVYELMKTVPCMAQLKEHVSIFDIITYLVVDDPGTIDEP